MNTSENTKQNKKYSIIIPSLCQPQFLANCINSIIKYSEDYNFILIDNGYADKQIQEEIMPLLQSCESFKLIRNKENKGFIGAVNQGIKYVIEDDYTPFIIVMNDDTQAVENWLPSLNEPFEDKYYNIMASGSLTTTKGSWQGNFTPSNNLTYIILPENNMLAFFCTMFKTETFKTVGYLDEQISELGFGDDDDYCRRIHNNKGRLALCQKLVIPHHHRSTFKKLFDDKTIKDMQNEALNNYKKKHSIT